MNTGPRIRASLNVSNANRLRPVLRDGAEGRAKKKDAWDKADVIFKAVAALLSATATLAVVALGYVFTTRLEAQKSIDARVRLYSELISKREEMQAALRKDLFQSLRQSFGKQQSNKDPNTTILQLELFAQNFHEFINLGPLFKQVEREIAASHSKDKNRLLKRLYLIADDITNKQRVILEGSGKKFDRTVRLDLLRTSAGEIELPEENIVVDGIARNMKVYISTADPTSGVITGRIDVKPQNEDVHFNCGPFDFPMISNVALSYGQHCAVILNNLIPDQRADISIVCFPRSCASLKEQAYYEEALRNVFGESNGSVLK